MIIYKQLNKKGISAFLLLFLIFGKIYAQEGKELVRVCSGLNYQKLVDKLIDFKAKSTDKIEYEWYTVLEREIIPRYSEQLIEFKKYVKDAKEPHIESVYEFSVKLIKTSEGNIIFYNVLKGERSLKKESTEMLAVFKTKFDSIYHSPLNFDELFVTNIRFGKKCGINGIDPDHRLKMEKLVTSKDTATLIKWLKSATAEIQLYALEGILTLESQGMIFDQKVQNIVELIKNKQGTAFTCGGCIHYNDSISHLVEDINIKTEIDKNNISSKPKKNGLNDLFENGWFLLLILISIFAIGVRHKKNSLRINKITDSNP
ncbi:MAG: hypothetical protein H6607_13335 [Flavobacteriales bacterium]|nr:hypothetical protein [Flavobacteriales bacterium]